MIRKRKTRRTLGFALIVFGAFLMWAAASPIAGSVMFALAIALEVAGITLERRNDDEKPQE